MRCAAAVRLNERRGDYIYAFFHGGSLCIHSTRRPLGIGGCVCVCFVGVGRRCLPVRVYRTAGFISGRFLIISELINIRAALGELRKSERARERERGACR